MLLQRCGRSSQSLNAIKHRSSCPEVFCKKVLWNIAKFTGQHLCQSVFSNIVAGLRTATLLKRRLWHRWFPVNFVKFPRTHFFIEHLWWLLLKAIATLFSIGTASRNRVSCFSSLFLTKVTTSINLSGVIRKSALNCCLLARSSLFFTYDETKVILGKRSKPFFQLWNQWSIIQYLNFVSEKIFFLAISIYGYCFCGVFYDY